MWCYAYIFHVILQAEDDNLDDMFVEDSEELENETDLNSSDKVDENSATEQLETQVK